MPATGSLLLDEDDAFEFLQNAYLARPDRSRDKKKKKKSPLTEFDMRAA